ncbi:MAG: fluoride efflux transporter CrcB [Epulopiscium sp.]|jgi:CrcB protein|nr:fluoride efflux transporter CrcB [Candidatus Epulonipiscium sp.]
MIQIVFVGLGGCLGSVLRYLISLATSRLFGSQFPWGTLLVNMTGGALIGFLMAYCIARDVPPEIRLFLTTGFLGGLTTFSTFSYETIQMILAGNWGIGLLNIATNLALSLGGVWLGRMAFTMMG